MSFLEIKNVSKKYNNQIVLDKVNYIFPSKGLFALVGESGSGKSTFINCINGIETVDKGEIIFNGEKIKNFEKFRNKYIRVIYQNSNLISFLNVKENINLLNNKEDNLLLDIDNFINTKINVLSGGESQRIAILRALSSSCKILLCDEPCGSLDKNNGKIVLDILKEMSKKILVIVVTHNIKLIKQYNPNVIKLENKKIVGKVIKEEKNEVFREKPKFLSLFKVIKIAIKTLFNKPTKIITSLISLCLSFTFFLFTFSSSTNINRLIETNKTKYLDYTYLSIVKEKMNKIENSSLTLVKEEMLTKEDINELSYLIDDLSYYHYDLLPIFSSFPLINHPINSNYYLSNIEWVPYFKENELNFSDSIKGRFSLNENEVVINKAASKYFSSSRFVINIDRVIDFKLSNNEIISDQYSINKNFNIVGEVEEFDLLQTPKIYYRYDYLLKLSKEIKLDNLSSYYQVPITLYDRLSSLRGEEDAFASNKLILKCDVSKVENIYDSINSIVKEKESFKVYSTPLSKLKTFEAMFDSILTVLKIFLFITLLISVSLLILVLFSYIVDFKKDIGIMMGCGVLKVDINFIFMFQSLILTFLSSLGSVLIYNLMSNYINSFLYSLCGINVLTNKVNFESGLILFSFSIFLSLFLSLLITYKITKLNIASILKED